MSTAITPLLRFSRMKCQSQDEKYYVEGQNTMVEGGYYASETAGNFAHWTGHPFSTQTRDTLWVFWQVE